MKALLKNTIANRALLLMALPSIILLFMFAYVPMFGLVVAFKKFNYIDGILGSPWVGINNFKFLFTSASTTWRMIRNTVGYYFLFTILGTVANIVLALALHECINKRFAKISHTIMILPTFLSWIAMVFIVNALLSMNTGLVNNWLIAMGKKPVQWYLSAKSWPYILTILSLWKSTGYGSILYLSALAGMDQELFEAAALDGATKMQQVRYITLPMLTSMVCILTLMSLGGIMTSNTGLFYQVTMNTGALYSTTQTIDAYVMNALMNSGTSNFGMTSAVSFFQSAVGCIMVVSVNMLVRRWEPEYSLF